MEGVEGGGGRGNMLQFSGDCEDHNDDDDEEEEEEEENGHIYSYDTSENEY